MAPPVEPVTGTPTTSTGKPGAKTGLSAWVTAHKGPAAGLAAVAGYALYKRSQNSTATAASLANGTTTGTAGGTVDTTGTDQYNALEGQIQSLSNGLQTLLASSTSGANTTGNANTTTTSTPAPTNASTPAPPLPPVNSAASPVVGSTSNPWDVLGTITGADDTFTGMFVQGGAPVYALQNGKWVQDWKPGSLPVGTQLATPAGYAPYVIPGVKTAKVS